MGEGDVGSVSVKEWGWGGVGWGGSGCRHDRQLTHGIEGRQQRATRGACMQAGEGGRWRRETGQEEPAWARRSLRGGCTSGGNGCCAFELGAQRRCRTLLQPRLAWGQRHTRRSHDGSHAGVHQVLHDDAAGVACTHAAGGQHAEASLHEEHNGGAAGGRGAGEAGGGRGGILMREAPQHCAW